MRWFGSGSRLVIAGLTVVAVACGDASGPTSTTSSIDGPGGAESPSTTTSGFAGPVDTTPRPFGPSLVLPLVDGYGVLCSGAAASDGFWYVTLEGPFARPELGEFEPTATAYEIFLEDAGFEVTRPVDEVGRLRVTGVGDDAVVTLEMGNTVHSNLVVAAWAPEPDGFSTVAGMAAGDSDCYGVVAGMIAPDDPEQVVGSGRDEIGEVDLPEIYVAVAEELAQLGHVDDTVYFGDRIADVPEAEPAQTPGLIAVGTPLSEPIRTGIVEAVTDFEVEFGPDWTALAQAECQAGRPWGQYVHYKLGTTRPVDDDIVEVLVELNGVNSPTWEKITLDRSSDGWQVVERESTGMFSPADACL